MNSATNGYILVFAVMPLLFFMAYKIGESQARLDRLCALVASIERVLIRSIESQLDQLPPKAAAKLRETLEREKDE